MKRLEVYLRNGVGVDRAKNKEKRVDTVLTVASLNFEDQRDKATLQIDKLSESLATCENINNIIQQISEQMDIREEAERGIERISQIRKYFNEDIEVAEK